MLIGLAISLVLLGAVATAVGLGWRLGDQEPAVAAAATASVETQLECTTIRREFDAWTNRTPGLTELPQWRDVDPGFPIKSAMEDGDALYKAAHGYRDQPSKELALAVAEYNAEVSMLNVEITLGGKYTDANYDKAMSARSKVQQVYGSFAKQTCG